MNGAPLRGQRGCLGEAVWLEKVPTEGTAVPIENQRQCGHRILAEKLRVLGSSPCSATGTVISALGPHFPSWLNDKMGHMVFIYLAASCLRCSMWTFVVVQATVPCRMWDLSSSTRDRSCIPSIGRLILSHHTTREIPGHMIFTGLSNLQFWGPESGMKHLMPHIGNMADVPRAEVATRLHLEHQFQLTGGGYLECHVEKD